MSKHPAITAKVDYKSVTVQFHNAEGQLFWGEMDENGIKFYSERSSSGTLEGNPIEKSGADLFNWICSEGLGKEFGERKSFQTKKS